MLKQRMIEVDGATLEAFVGGVGGPTVCESHPFSAQTAEGGPLADLCRLVRVNPRGVGQSSAGRGPRDFTFGQHVDDLEAVRQRLGVERWVYRGGSGGACIGLLYALQAPHALSGLILAWNGPSGRRIAADARSLFSPQHLDYQSDLRTASPLRRHPSALEPFGTAPAE